MSRKSNYPKEGIRLRDSSIIDSLKENFKNEFIDNNQNMATAGYFIGKTLLRSILLNYKESDGILISFGLNKEPSSGGNLQLIIEAASEKPVKSDKIVIHTDKDQFATGVIGDEGPDNLIPAIKPTGG